MSSSSDFLLNNLADKKKLASFGLGNEGHVHGRDGKKLGFLEEEFIYKEYRTQILRPG